MEKERRLAAIMFTDIVGYTKLMQASESKAMQVRQRHREVFEAITRKYQGEIIQYYGDGTLSIFSSTVNAVHCGLELQKEFRRKPVVPLRIGIHSGDIVIDKTDIIGDSVNVASRVESLGVPGAVLVSERVVGEVRNQDDLRFKLLGAFHFKNVEKPMQIFALAAPGLAVPKARQLSGKLEQAKMPKGIRALKISRLNAALALLLMAVIVLSAWLLRRQYNIYWARYEVLPQVEALVESSWQDYTEAHRLARVAEKYIPRNKRLQELIGKTVFPIDIRTTPAGARVYVKEYKHPEDPWIYLGETPLDIVILPKGFFRWMIEKAGYDTVYAAESTFALTSNPSNFPMDSLIEPQHFFRILDPVGSIPAGMTRVSGGKTRAGWLSDFYVDRYEVTNRQFKAFINAGGYRDTAYWKQPFVEKGRVLSWQEAISRFVDQTGRTGPSTWLAGDFPEGEEDFPVGGISWYEAAAYAEFAGKTLPTIYHWNLARGVTNFVFRYPQLGGFALWAPFCNFSQKGPVAVGSLAGITTFGAHDMAGNAREWCWNETKQGRSVRGGAWNENTYNFGNLAQEPAFDRSPANGFRCVKYLAPDSIPDAAFAQAPPSPYEDFDLNPVSDEVFEVYRSLFDYEKRNLHAEIIYRDSSHRDWVEEKVVFNAAYGNERMTAYVFLPTNSLPPFQTVVYYPGSASFLQVSSENITEYYEFPLFLEFLIKTGRAVVYPVYQGTFERKAGAFDTGLSAMSMVVKDFRTCVDYLHTRQDIDTGRIAYYGMSEGGAIGPIICALEDRIKANIFLAGGLYREKRPEIRSLHYLPRVKAPTLMLNGKYDSLFSLEEAIQPMFKLLGTPDAQKKLALFESDHLPPRNEMIRAILDWLDEQFGPVRLGRV